MPARGVAQAAKRVPSACVSPSHGGMWVSERKQPPEGCRVKRKQTPVGRRVKNFKEGFLGDYGVKLTLRKLRTFS